MRIRSAVLAILLALLFALVACGGSATGPDNASPGPTVSPDIQVVRGGGQRDTVERVLGDDDCRTPR